MSGRADEQLCAVLVGRFRDRGFDAERLPADNVHKIPDIEIRQGPERYLVEVKQKLDDTDVAQKREDVLARGEVADFTEFARRTALDKVIRSAVEQLRARAGADETTFRVVWIECEGGNSPGQALQVYNAAYGFRRLIERDGPMREGFYVGESAFFRHRDDLDAIVSYDIDGGRILLNTYSPRFARLRDSAMVRLFRAGGADAVVDPVEKEWLGEAFLADCNLPRNDEAAVLLFVKQKYGTNDLMAMDLAAMAGVIRVPEPANRSTVSSAAPADKPSVRDAWCFPGDLPTIVSALGCALPEPWEPYGTIRLYGGRYEAIAKVRRRSNGQTSTVRIDLLEKRINAEDLERLANPRTADGYDTLDRDIRARIELRAYFKWLHRGQHGHDLDDWLEAEREEQSMTLTSPNQHTSHEAAAMSEMRRADRW